MQGTHLQGEGQRRTYRGAVCFTCTRYELHDESGARLEPGCFATMPRCASLDDPAAAGAVLANDSYVTPITACQ